MIRKITGSQHRGHTVLALALFLTSLSPTAVAERLLRLAVSRWCKSALQRHTPDQRHWRLRLFHQRNDGRINANGPDKFRIKIWNKANGVLVYDNQLGSSDQADPTTVLYITISASRLTIFARCSAAKASGVWYQGQFKWSATAKAITYSILKSRLITFVF